MITFEEAKQIALHEIGPNCGLIEEATIEKLYGWFFSFQSKEWLRTGKLEEALVGSKGFIVEKENGRIFRFGSIYSLERDFEQYEKGFKYERYDLTITSIKDRAKTLELLYLLNMIYTMPGYKPGKPGYVEIYTKKQLKGILAHIPCKFVNQGFYFRVDVFEKIDKLGCCTYKIRGRPGNITEGTKPGVLVSESTTKKQWWQFWK